MGAGLLLLSLILSGSMLYLVAVGTPGAKRRHHGTIETMQYQQVCIEP